MERYILERDNKEKHLSERKERDRSFLRVFAHGLEGYYGNAEVRNVPVYSIFHNTPVLKSEADMDNFDGKI